MATSVEQPAHPSGVHGLRTEGQVVALQSSGTASNESVGTSLVSLVTGATPQSPPPPPNPSEDTKLIPNINTLPAAEPVVPGFKLECQDGELNLLTIRPETVMKLLSRAVNTLATFTGDVPASPALQMVFRSDGILDSGKENASGRHGTIPALKDFKPDHVRTGSRPQTPTPVPDHDLKTLGPIPLSSPEANPQEPAVPIIQTPPATLDASVEESMNVQDDERKENLRQRQAQAHAIARKFFSKTIPPITIDLYLDRMQRYCPMSTAVWLAAAHYLSVLSVPNNNAKPLVPITPRTVHRLLLAALRVAMKALEDLRYPQARFAGVGGVTEAELKSLEISLCYLMDFELQADEAKLIRGLMSLQRASAGVERMRFSVSGASGGGFQLMHESLALRIRRNRDNGTGPAP